MTGVVLCGGQSSRMQSDKGLLMHHSVTWAQLTAEKLSSLEIPVVISVNNAQFPVYKTIFQSTHLIKDDEGLDFGGPMKGVLSVHVQHPEEDLLVLACDMVNMQTDVLRYLVSKSLSADSEGYIFINGDVVEAMCGIYTSGGLQKIVRMHTEGTLKKHSMYHLAHRIDACFIPIPDGWEKYFLNFNSPDDLNLL